MLNFFPAFKGRFGDGECSSGHSCEKSLIWKSDVHSCPLMGAITSIFPERSHDNKRNFDLRPNKRTSSDLAENCEPSKTVSESGKNENSIEIRPELTDGCQKHQRLDYRKKGHHPQGDKDNNRYQAHHRPTDSNRNWDHDRDRDYCRGHDRGLERDHDRNYERDHNRDHERDHNRVHDRDFHRDRDHDRYLHRDRGQNRVQERDHRFRERDRILRIRGSPERKPRDPPRRQLSEPDPRRSLSSIDRKQWLKELEEDWVQHCTAQWKADVQKLVHLDVVQAEDCRYSCTICRTGKMSLTALMGSHVSGKKHQVLAAKSGIYWHPETPTFKNKNIILGTRKRPPPSKSLSVPLEERCNPPSPQERTIPHVIPKLDRNNVGPLYLKCKYPVEEPTQQIPDGLVEMEMEMPERMAEQWSEQLLSEEMRDYVLEDVVEYDPENLEISETLEVEGNPEVSVNPAEIPNKEMIPENAEIICRDPLECFLEAGAYRSMYPSGLPLNSEYGTSKMEACDILSKWNQLQYDLKSTPSSFGLPFSGWTQQQPEEGQFYCTGEWNHPQQSWVQQMEQQQQHQPD